MHRHALMSHPVGGAVGALACATLVSLSSPAHAASGACTVATEATDCALGQQCRGAICVWEAPDRVTLTNAITAANVDAALDVIFIGTVDTNLPAQIGLAGEPVFANDPGLGPRALPKITSAIRIEGLPPNPASPNAGEQAGSVIDDNADQRIFLVDVDPLTNFRPSLTLQALTIADARPGPNGAGAFVGAGAVTVTAARTVAIAPALPESSSFTSLNVNYVGCRIAGCIANDGAPLSITGGSVVDSASDAGAIVTSSTGGQLIAGTFLNNAGAAGVVSVPNGTRVDESGATVDVTLQVSGVTFEGNQGQDAGALRSLANATSVTNGTFRNNRTGGVGGAVAARNLTLTGGVFDGNFAGDGGGAVALLDTPPGDGAELRGADFDANSSGATGGAVLASGANVLVDDCIFEGNTALGGGGAVHLAQLVDRNGAAEPDAVISDSVFRQNSARPAVVQGAVDNGLDERGDDTGSIAVTVAGSGSAVLVDASNDVDVTNSCFLGNGAAALSAANGSTGVTVVGNWWNAATGPAPAGDGDLVEGTGIEVGTPAATPPPACELAPFAAYPQLFVPASINVVSTATIGVDFALFDADRNLRVLSTPTGDLVPDTRRGVLNIEARGVNDLDVEGDEEFLFEVALCEAFDCPYFATPATAPNRAFTISDNGDGVGEGEGEGEGEDDCAEVLDLSTTTLLFSSAATPEAPAQATLTVSNGGPCEIELLRPFVQAGATQGFSVEPILLTALQLAPGAALDIVALYEPPEEDVSSGDAPPAGALRIETRRGTVVEIALALDGDGCSCAAAPSASAGAAPLLGVAAAAALVLVSGGRRKRSARR